MKFSRSLFSAIMLTAAVAASGTSTFAKIFNAKARSGKTIQLYRFLVYDTSDCGALAYPKTTFKTTSNGTITVKKFTGRLKLKGRCNGKIAKGMAVYYKSIGGFRGADKATIYFSFPVGADGSGYLRVEKLRFNINVK